MTDRLELAIEQIKFAHEYTCSMLQDVEPADWFRQPTESVTHIAWQVGHLAMAEYGLTLFRVRGRRSEDAQLMSGPFRKKFSKGSVPNPDPNQNPDPDEIRSVWDRVHEQALRELPTCSDQTLDEPVDFPYAVYPTKLGSLLFCPAHEMMHAGQIGLLRRLLGYPPIR